MNKTEREALRLFRIVNGPGDSGSQREFDCQNPATRQGWIRLARHVIRREKKAQEPEPVKYSRHSAADWS